MLTNFNVLATKTQLAAYFFLVKCKIAVRPGSRVVISIQLLLKVVQESSQSSESPGGALCVIQLGSRRQTNENMCYCLLLICTVNQPPLSLPFMEEGTEPMATSL